jgi:hypothetical protein
MSALILDAGCAAAGESWAKAAGRVVSGMGYRAKGQADGEIVVCQAQ